jgi:hypothetical protein
MQPVFGPIVAWKMRLVALAFEAENSKVALQ